VTSLTQSHSRCKFEMGGMTALQGHHPLVAIRTRSRRPASLLTVVLVAAATLALAVAAAALIDDDGAGSASPAPQPVAKAAPEPAPRAAVLTPRVTETPGRTTPVPAGPRYDGGPALTDLSRPHYEGRELVPGR
jgi:hypothetical protein